MKEKNHSDITYIKKWIVIWIYKVSLGLCKTHQGFSLFVNTVI